MTPILTVTQLSEYLQVKPLTIYKHAKRVKIPGFKIGRCWRFRMEAIDKWIDSQENLR